MKNKKAVSAMIGYILLIGLATVIGTLTYTWMKTYVPSDKLDCPDDVSIYIKEINCNGTQLNITIKNNGLFNIAGYFIKATDAPSQKLATYNIAPYLDDTRGGDFYGDAIIFGINLENSVKPDDEKKLTFNLNKTIYSVELLPARFQEENNLKRFVSCSQAIVKEKVTC